MMGHKVSIYHDIQMKGVEFLRNLYTASGLSIAPKTKVTQIEMLKQIIRALGGDPERAALEQAFTKPRRTYVGQPERDEDTLNTLKTLLRDLIRRELVEATVSSPGSDPRRTLT